MRPLSYSQISLYQSCPLNYKFQYIDRMKPRDKWYFSFGSSLHLCAEYFFKVKVPPPPSLDALLKYYEKVWLSKGYESAEEEAKYKIYGREILTRFWELHSADFRMPVAVEHLFYIDVDGVKLRGYIDRIDKLDSGGLSIVDYKTSQQLFTKEYLKNDLQLTLYQLAIQEMWYLPVEKLTLYHLRSNTPCTSAARDTKQLDEARRLVVEVAESITRQRFPAVENPFCPCDFAEHCPYYRHKYMTSETEAGEVGRLQGAALEEAIEDYASLQGQIKELELKLKEKRQAIIDFCQAEEVTRVYSREHAITCKLVDKTGFDEEEVKALLEPEALWPRVLGLDRARLEQLIADKAVAEDIRQRLEKLRRLLSSTPHLWVRRLLLE